METWKKSHFLIFLSSSRGANSPPYLCCAIYWVKVKEVATHTLLSVKHQSSAELREVRVRQVAPGLHLLPNGRKKKEKKKSMWVAALHAVTSQHPGRGLVSDLKLVFEKAHVGDSVVDLRQQSFHVLHRDAGRRRRSSRWARNRGTQRNRVWLQRVPPPLHTPASSSIPRLGCTYCNLSDSQKPPLKLVVTIIPSQTTLNYFKLLFYQ